MLDPEPKESRTPGVWLFELVLLLLFVVPVVVAAMMISLAMKMPIMSVETAFSYEALTDAELRLVAAFSVSGSSQREPCSGRGPQLRP